jgi:hypothetical protein
MTPFYFSATNITLVAYTVYLWYTCYYKLDGGTSMEIIKTESLTSGIMPAKIKF